MKSSCLIFLAIALMAPAFANTERAVSKAPSVVRHDDAIRPLLEAWSKARQAPYDGPSSRVRLQFSDWYEVVSDQLTALFPGHRFASIRYDEVERRKSSGRIPGLDVGSQVTLAVNSATKRVIELYDSGDYMQFGQLLADGAVSIQTAADAKKIWAAFCLLHHNEWQSYPAMQADPNTWHLGVCEIGGFRYYYAITLGTDGKVASGILHADKIVKP